MKSHLLVELLRPLAKQDVDAAIVDWCKSFIGGRYADWWERKRHRELIEAKPTRPEHQRARRRLLELVLTDLDLRPDADVAVPDSLLGLPAGRHQQTCVVCGSQFASTRSDKRTCSTRCRVRQSRSRQQPCNT